MGSCRARNSSRAEAGLIVIPWLRKRSGLPEPPSRPRFERLVEYALLVLLAKLRRGNGVPIQQVRRAKATNDSPVDCAIGEDVFVLRERLRQRRCVARRAAGGLNR